jgi:hypothetical protein
VRKAYEAISQQAGVEWLAEPFAIEQGHVAVMRAADGNIFVLIGG